MPKWFNPYARKKFNRNIPAVLSFIIIIILILLACLAYLISPDQSPNANRQILEIQGKPPGFTQSFLKIPHSKEEPLSIVRHFLFGQPYSYQLLPITDYVKQVNGYRVEHYIDEDTTEVLFFPNAPTTKKQPYAIVKKTFWLGTDTFGRDVLSRALIGLRISLAVGFIAAFVSLFIGVTLGAIAGYYGGRADKIIQWLINVMWSIPTILLVFALTIALGKGFFQIFFAVGLTLWVPVARLVRGQVLVVRELEYIQAAITLGLPSYHIILRNILPNIIGPILVLTAANFASAILIESGLSFLGVGVQPPVPSLGLMLREHYTYIITNHAMLAIIPGLIIMLLVLVFNLVGNGLRDALDVRN